MANPEIINAFFDKLEDLVRKLGITDLSDHFWNCDKTGLSCVIKPIKVITAVRK